MVRTWSGAALLLLAAAAVFPETPAAPDPALGFDLLLNKAYLPAALDQEAFDAVWQVWPEPLRSLAKNASPARRRRMAYERYGLDPRPGDPQKRPLQYVVGRDGSWTMNCLLCHGGQVARLVWPGLPNSNLALQTLTSEIRLTKLRMKKKLADMDLGSLVMPLGTTNGTTNAVMFGVALMHGRDQDLKPTIRSRPLEMDHHDMDAPPWWHFKKKKRLYADNFAAKSHRSLMQFMLVPDNSGAQIRAWEDEFRHIFAYLETIRPPKWPHRVDAKLAARGKRVFEKHCARCHGRYGDRPSYPEKVVPLDELGTDPVRLKALRAWQRREYGKSWFTDYGKNPVVVEPVGYVAPPLDGIWASAPYFHNGSVPTLWHVLHPEDRPKVWRRTPRGYDRARVGLEIKELAEMPERLTDAAQRTYFDARVRGKSAAGHTFPDDLTEPQKIALLEYLKTL
ncbi:MAG: c-type cytochrome [Planctomycetota bacterium]|nr:c-type cytochrome [Planctomycetota bacterium]